MTDAELRLFQIRRDLEKQGLKTSGPASVGLVMGVTQEVIDFIGEALKKIKALERKVEEMQKTVDHNDKHALVFHGDWQVERTYYPGNLVRFKGGTYTALRDVAPGKAPPDRQGSGWSQVT